MQGFHTRDDRGRIPLLLYHQWSSVATKTIVLELSNQDEHQAFSDPENKKLLFKTWAYSSLGLTAHVGTLAHIRLSLNDDDLLIAAGWNSETANVEAQEPDTEVSGPGASISQLPSTKHHPSSFHSIDIELPWCKMLREFEVNRARQQGADREPTAKDL